MASDNPLGNAREEAERLVAAALAAAQFAARRAARRPDRGDESRPDNVVGDLAALAGIASRFLGREARARDARGYDARRRDAYDDIDDRRRTSGHQFANGSDACCSCPVCRVIDMVREPSPEFVQRVASGASDLASGVTSVLRAFGGAVRRPATSDVVDLDEPATDDVGARDAEADVRGAADEPGPGDEEAAPFAGGADFASIWQEATREAETKRPPRPSGPPSTPKPMAKKTVKKAVKPAAHRPGPAMAEPPAAPVPPVVKKAEPVVDTAPAPATAPTPATPTREAAKKAAPVKKAAVAKKAVAKKTAAKKAAGGTVVAKKAADGQTAKAAPEAAKKTAKKAT
jgi:hypothetical protein